ncbi:MAG: 2Fe-2S iron-sulfur cluster binding domain-containing protein [Rubrivivax sp.]|nr:2Fe-2S iron-sulfur cluster binding domain-containing protein [Rubrivivax sp.]
MPLPPPAHAPTPFRLNGTAVAPAADAQTPLLWVLRELLGLTGTKPGCLQGLCGACTVHLDGQPVRACQTPLANVAGHAVTTIEGLPPLLLQRLTQAWSRHHALQCGYCQPGQAMTAAALLAAADGAGQRADAGEVTAQLSAHLCRCGTQRRVVQSVLDALDAGAANAAAPARAES